MSMIVLPAEAVKRFEIRPCAEILGACVMKVDTKFEAVSTLIYYGYRDYAQAVLETPTRTPTVSL